MTKWETRIKKIDKTFIIILTIMLSFLFSLPAFSKETITYNAQRHGLGALKPKEKTKPNINIDELDKKLLIKGIKPTSMPAIVDWSYLLPPVGDQGVQGSCTAWAAGYYYKTFQEGKDHGWTDLTDAAHQFSPSFIYNQINGGNDNGIYIKDALSQVLIPKGDCTLSDFPYDQYDWTTQPTAEQLDLAFPHRALSYTKLSWDDAQDINILKKYINTGDIFVIGVPVYQSSWLSPSDIITLKDSKYDFLAGYHAICIVGYDDTIKTNDGIGAFKFVNSWGESWGDDGYKYISYSYINQGGFDSYAMTDLSEAALDSAIIESNDIPNTMIAGQSYTVNITVKNTGSNTWTAATGYKLGAVDGTDPFAAFMYPMDSLDSVGTNETKTFTFTMKAPSVTGTYTTDWQMLRNDMDWFGDKLNVEVEVHTPYDAQVVSHTIPAVMAPGQSYSVSVMVKNTGSNTWTAAEGYKLGALGNTDPFAITRQLIDSTESIAANQMKTFTFTMKAPSVPGTYTTDWRMLREGVMWFGDKLEAQVTVTAYGASFVTHDIPSTMVAGQSYTINVTVKNTGGNTWTAAEGYKLGAVGNSDPFAVTRQLIGSTDSIAVNQTKTFTFVMKAPSTPGTYITDWRMLREGVMWFGDKLNVEVTVDAPYDAEIIDSTIPTAMAAGETYKVSIMVKNTGGNTWTAAEGYKLGAVGNTDPFASARQYLSSSDTITPGNYKVFTFTMKAPSTPGTYTTDWRMLREGVAWFGDKLDTQVTVPAYNAKLVDCTMPTIMNAGQTYQVDITVLNTGGNTWTAAENYKLGAVGDSDPFAQTRINMSSFDVINPNSTKTFTFLMKAPDTPGIYTSDWRMLREGVTWFGDVLTEYIDIASISPYDAELVSFSCPEYMNAGQSYTASIKVKNTGSNTWTADDGYMLGAVDGSDPFASACQLLGPTESIATNQTKTFDIIMTAPLKPGTYVSDWRMLREGVNSFGDILSLPVIVTAIPYSAQMVSNTIPATMIAGQTYSVNVTVKNTGSSTWTAADGYKLGALDNSDFFASTRRLLGGSDSIASGQSKTFTFNMTAPPPGSYNIGLQMLQEGVKWFGETLTRNVTVSSTAPLFKPAASSTTPESNTRETRQKRNK
jgi:methionine-rich copper-binding protein CopC